MAQKRDHLDNIVDLIEALKLSSPKEECKNVQWKYVLIMADSVWNGESAYCGREVTLSVEWILEFGNWICPVSELNGPVPTKAHINIGHIITVPVVRHAEDTNQSNWIVDQNIEWRVIAQIPKLLNLRENQYDVIRGMGLEIEQNMELWHDDTCRPHIPNERISTDKLHDLRQQPGYQSCRMIHVESLVVSLFHRTYGKLDNGNDIYRNIRRGKFMYLGRSYELTITERYETLLRKVGEEELLALNPVIFPHETEKIETEILSCYLLVTLPANKAFTPNDDPTKQYYYKLISHIYTKGAEAEVQDLNQFENENLPTCEQLLHASFTVPYAITLWEKGFLQNNMLKDYWNLTDKQQRIFVEIHDKIRQNCHLN